MNKKYFVTFSAILLIIGFIATIPAVADAQIVPCGGTTQPSCNFCHIFELVGNIVTYLLMPAPTLNGGIPLVPVLATLLVAVGGFLMFLGMGGGSRLQQGRNVISATIIGMFIIYGAYMLLSLALTAVGVAAWTGLGNWWQITCTIP